MSQHTTDQTVAVDPRPAFHRATDVAIDVVAAVRPDQLDTATPCEGMNVRDLLRHLHMAISRAGSIPDLASADQLPGEDHSIDDSAVAEAIDAAIAAARRAWVDDDRLTQPMTLPWMQAPGADVLAVYLNEVIVHTWDLARATGQTPTWDDDDVELATRAIRAQLPDADRDAMWAAARSTMPAEYLRVHPWQDPFANAVAVPADATPVERLVAWCGRTP